MTTTQKKFKTVFDYTVLAMMPFLLGSCSVYLSPPKISNLIEHSSMPSGSGMEKIGNNYYVVGDDSPFLFVLNEKFEIINKIPLIDTLGFDGKRIHKKVKPDFEAIAKINDSELAIFCSGSKSPERDYLFRVKLQDNITVERFSLTPFYTLLKTQDKMNGAELNLEGAVFWNGKLSLFNRTNNVVFTVDYRQFLSKIMLQELPEILSVDEFLLPSIQGLPSGFSGASFVQKQGLILFTSSVEGNKNAYHDGAILGSFVGSLDISSGNMQLLKQPKRVSYNNVPLKIESISLIKSLNKKRLRVAMITDNDDGKSMILDGIIGF